MVRKHTFADLCFDEGRTMQNRMMLGWHWPHTPTGVRSPTRNVAEQTEASWAELIESYNAVPDAFKDFFLIAEGQQFPYTVLTPSYEGFIHPTTEKLICDFQCEIYVLERNGNTFDAHCYPLEGISCIEVRMILLDSSIKIVGVTKEGVLKSSIFRFNSVSDYLFEPILQKIRYATGDTNSAAQNLELEKFDPWREINYKFMNYARRSLLAGEKVIHTVLQPEIREPVLKGLVKKFYRVVAPTLAGILTDQELIMIQEEKTRSGEERYGGIWVYIPLKKILTLSLSEVDNNLLTLSIKLTEGTCHEFLFRDSLKQELHRLRYRFQEMMIA